MNFNNSNEADKIAYLRVLQEYEMLKNEIKIIRAMEIIKPTIQLVVLLGFRVASIGTYFNMLLFTRLETKQKSCILLACFNISMALNKKGLHYIAVDGGKLKKFNPWLDKGPVH